MVMKSEMNRRRFLQVAGMGAAAAAMGSICKAARMRKPNIIYVMVDDMGIGDLGCYGQKKIKTPNIDRLGREGMRFTNHYAGSPICGPTRCSLMTGLHTGHCTRRGNQTKAGSLKLLPLRKEDYTVASMLKKAGYVTGGIGKWGLGNPGTTGVPEKHGFDYFYGYYDQVHAHSYYTDYLILNGKEVPIAENKGGKRKVYAHDLFAEATFDFIRRHKDEPFFLYLPFTIPHGKYEVPDDGPYSDEDWPQQAKNYAAMITRMDGDIGRMMKLLKEVGIDDDTIVFFTSDNGPNPPFIKAFGSHGGFRGRKGRLYEGGIRMPMIVRQPGRIAAGTVSDYPWVFYDLMATAAELAGIDPPGKTDGISVVPTLSGKKQKVRDFFYWEFYSPFHQAVRMGKWKGIRFGTKEPMELYDLSVDEFETKDIAADHQDIVKKIGSIMEREHVDTPYWPVVERVKKPAKRKGKKK